MEDGGLHTLPVVTLVCNLKPTKEVHLLLTTAMHRHAELEQPMLDYVMAENNRMKPALLDVEFYDEQGNTVWKCDDIREGRMNNILYTDELPNYEEEDVRYWRPHVWTLEVPIQGSKTEFVLKNSCWITEIRVGLHRWKVQLGLDVGLDFTYDSKNQTHGMTLPMVRTEISKRWAPDALGPDGVYLTGTCTVTDPEVLEVFTDPEAVKEGDFGDAWDMLRDVDHNQRKLRGVHDAVRVQYVHLPLSGYVLNTLKLFHACNENIVEATSPSRWSNCGNKPFWD